MANLVRETVGESSWFHIRHLSRYHTCFFPSFFFFFSFLLSKRMVRTQLCVQQVRHIQKYTLSDLDLTVLTVFRFIFISLSRDRCMSIHFLVAGSLHVHEAN